MTVKLDVATDQSFELRLESLRPDLAVSNICDKGVEDTAEIH